MTKLLGMVFSARAGGNHYDLARELFSGVAAQLPGLETEIINIANQNLQPCNGCDYDCLLGDGSCPLADDALALWRRVLESDLLVYFIPAYGGLPPASWVAFQQRYHGVFRLPEAAGSRGGKVAVVTTYEPLGVRNGDISQNVILHTLAGGKRQLVCFEQIIPSNYGLNSLHDRLVAHEEIQDRLAAMGARIVRELGTLSA